MKLLPQKLCLLLFFLAMNSSCQNKNEKAISIENNTNKMDFKKFEWQENINSPLGYPMEVYRGGLESQEGGYVSLNLGPTANKNGWGATGSGMSSGEKALPNRLNLIWLSYAEESMFEINTKIDYEKMQALFETGYKIKGASGAEKKANYDTIIVGFAPGGIIVVWVSGAGKQVEIGRYEGKKYTVPEAEIAKLDSNEKLLFDANNRKRIMQNPNMVPLEIQEKNKGKEIPFGLWDEYRVKYNWSPVFSSNMKKIKVVNFHLEMVNGEKETEFGELMNQSEAKERAVPKLLNFGWRDETGQLYGGKIIFNEASVLKAFKEISKESSSLPVELHVEVNSQNTYFAIQLQKGTKIISLKDNDIETYKSNRK